MSNVYLDLTQEFNAGRVRAVISSGQAVVLHRLAIMSKDGDWILREDDEATSHVLAVLDHHRARYRFGAPLDVRWLEGGWSSHFEFVDQGIRVRADFVTRPPRIDPAQLEQLWAEQRGRGHKVDRSVASHREGNPRRHIALGPRHRRASGAGLPAVQACVMSYLSQTSAQ